ncbi:hypothetical protein CTI14_57730, partial [Methylobacterium radiotolerans]
VLTGKKLALVAILRAGLIMTEAIVTLVPAAKVGTSACTATRKRCCPVAYYNKLPADIAERRVFVRRPSSRVTFPSSPGRSWRWSPSCAPA